MPFSSYSSSSSFSFIIVTRYFFFLFYFLFFSLLLFFSLSISRHGLHPSLSLSFSTPDVISFIFFLLFLCRRRLFFLRRGWPIQDERGDDVAGADNSCVRRRRLNGLPLRYIRNARTTATEAQPNHETMAHCSRTRLPSIREEFFFSFYSRKTDQQPPFFSSIPIGQNCPRDILGMETSSSTTSSAFLLFFYFLSGH